MHRFLFTLLLSVTGLHAIAQTNLYVDSSINTSGNGGTWATAYKTLNEALNAANNAGTTPKFVIHLAKGTYYPTGVQNSTARDSAFGIFRGGVQLLGGYPSGGGARNAAQHASILSGNIGAAAIDTDNSHHIMVISGLPATADSLVLDGLSFTGGYAREYSGGVLKLYNGASFYTDYGGALYQKNIFCPGVINDCSFYGNNAYEQGGAICNSASYVPIAHCLFTGNTTTSNSQGEGGAVYNYAYSPTISYCTFTGNNTNSKGGAIFNFSTSTGAGISYCTFTNNGCREDSTGYGAGGAIYESSTQLAPVSYCTFTGNYTIGTTGDGGGAIFHAGYYPSSVNSPYVNYCTFNGNSSNRGGAIALSSFCAVMNSTFTGNKASESGGAIARTGLGNTMNCTFTNDTAVYGGALYNCGATDCRLISNYAAYGGGAYSRSINSYLNRNVFSGNVATVNGGGLYWKGTFSSNSNLLFSGNKAYGNGGAIYDTANSTSFVHCTFSGDTAAAGNGIYNINASGSFTNCIVWEGNNSIANANSTVSVRYSLVQGGYTGTGNIAANPVFIAPLAATAAATTGGNYNLQPCSPAIGVANTAAANDAGTTDLAGNPRILGNGPDMGAYEYQSSPGLAISGSSAVCINSTLQLSNDYPNGTWATNNTAVATVSTTGLVTGVSAGTAIITYAISSACGNFTLSKNITVNALPAVASITGGSQACTGSTIQLGNATTGGIWASTNPGIATVNSAGTITPMASGNAGITYTVTDNNGCAASVSKSVAVSTAYHDTMTAATCAGTPYMFAGQPLNAAGIYNHLYQTVSGCDSNIALVLSVTNINATASLSGTTLTASPAGAVYQWIDCNGNTPIPGATGQSFTPAANGQYAVIITKNGCTQTSACKSVTTVGVTTVGEGLPATVLVSPNPVSGVLTINTGKRIAAVIFIKDITGKILAELHPDGAKTLKVDMRSYLPGIYLLDIQSNGERYSTRISVVH